MGRIGLERRDWTAPELDPSFVPLARLFLRYRHEAAEPFAVALERENGQVSVYETALFGTAGRAEEDRYYLERLVKFLLWCRGGFHVMLCGNETLGRAVAEDYLPGGPRNFDREFMERIYERPFTVEVLPYSARPAPREGSGIPGDKSGCGCRIGLDVGASGRKVSAVQDGTVVYSGEEPWQPKTNPDPQYHLQAITASLRDAAGHLPRVDGIGVSSAGVFVENRCMVASLFLAVEREKFGQVRDIYLQAGRSVGEEIPLVVANDGDVTALAGSLALGENAILGISMGTSEAGGYVDGAGRLTGWLNELAFCPVDAQSGGAVDEWSGDVGCGVKYLSQDAAILLAERAGIPLPEGNPSRRFRAVRALAEAGDPRAETVYRDLGVYLGHAAALYSLFYDLNRVLVMGGVSGGPKGDLILDAARGVLAVDYPDITLKLSAPDDRVRALGQSVAAASLPQIR